MAGTTGIHHIASSLGIFGEVRQERQNDQIRLTLGGKGTITFPSDINEIVEQALNYQREHSPLPAGEPHQRKIEKIQTALRLFFWDQFPSQKLEQKLVKYANPVEIPHEDRARMRHDQLIEAANDVYEKAPNMSNVLIIFGRARIGKSTGINAWAKPGDIELVDAQEAFGLMDTREPNIIIARHPISGIGHRAIPKTKLPALIETHIRLNETDEGINICDTQGLFDLDPETELFNSTTLVEVLKHIRSIKGFGIAMAEQDLPNYESVKNEFKAIQMVLGDFRRFQHSICFVIMKCRYPLAFNVRRLKQTINDIIPRERENDPAFVRFLTEILESGILDNKVKECHPLDADNRIEILTMFNQLAYPADDPREFGYPLSPVARLSFVAAMTTTVLKIGRSLDNYQGTILQAYTPQPNDTIAGISQTLHQFNAWLAHFPTRDHFTLDSVIDVELVDGVNLINPFHRNQEHLRSLTTSRRYITQFNLQTEQKAYLDRENAGRALEGEKARDAALVASEEGMIISLNRLYDELLQVRSLLMYEIVKRTLKEGLGSYAARRETTQIKERVPHATRDNYQGVGIQQFALMLTAISEAPLSPLPYDSNAIEQILQDNPARRNELNLLLRDNLFEPYHYIDRGRTRTVQVPATAIALHEIMSTVSAAAISTLIIDAKKPNTHDGTLYFDQDFNGSIFSEGGNPWRGKHIVLKANNIEIVNPPSTASSSASSAYPRRIVSLGYSLLHGGSITLLGIKATSAFDHDTLILTASETLEPRIAFQWPLMGD